MGLDFFDSSKNDLKLTVKVDITNVTELLKSHIHFFKFLFILNQVVLLVFAELDLVNVVNECLKGLWGSDKLVLNCVETTKYLFSLLAGKIVKVGSDVDLLLLDFGHKVVSETLTHNIDKTLLILCFDVLIDNLIPLGKTIDPGFNGIKV